MKRLILIRHASTILNEKKVLSGKIDAKISKKGLLEIERLNKRLDKILLEDNILVDRIYTSNSSRTEDTIKDFAKKKSIQIKKIENLSEIDFGEFEGKSFDYIKNKYPKEYDKLCNEGFKYKYPNGENAIEAYEKNKKAIDFILDDMLENQTAIICAHGGSIRNALSYLINKSYKNHWNFKVDNAKITVIEIDFEFAVLTKLNI